MIPADWENVLVVQSSFLGDTVLTLPLLSEIKRHFPAGKLTLLCAPVAAELLGAHALTDEIMIDDKRGRDAGILGLWRKAKILEQKKIHAGHFSAQVTAQRFVVVPGQNSPAYRLPPK